MTLTEDTIEGRIARAAAEAVLDKLRPLLEPLLEPNPATPPAPSQGHTTPHDGKLFLTVTEAAELLGVNRMTCLRWESKKKLPPRSTMGGKTGWSRAEIDHFLANLPKRPPLRMGRKAQAN